MPRCSEGWEIESRMANSNFDNVIEHILSKLEGNPIGEDVRKHLLSISSIALKENEIATER